MSVLIRLRPFEANKERLTTTYFQEFPIIKDVLSDDLSFQSYCSHIRTTFHKNIEKIKSIATELPSRPLVAILRQRYNPEQTFPVWSCEYAYESDIHEASIELCTWGILNPSQLISCSIADTKTNADNLYVVLVHILHDIFCVQYFADDGLARPNMTIELTTNDPVRQDAVIEEEIMDRVAEINRKCLAAAIKG